jgi:carbamoyl-phosphate synthase small subunit
VEITQKNVNDGTVEAFALKNRPVISVQYHPEASPGPEDSSYIFKDFIEMIKKGGKNA